MYRLYCYVWSRLRLADCYVAGHRTRDNKRRTFCVECGWYFDWS